MVKKNQHGRQPTSNAATTNYEAEYKDFCRQMRPDYEQFCRDHPAFLGGYGEYLEVMKLIRKKLRRRAELAAIDQEQKQLAVALYVPLAYQLQLPVELMDELLSFNGPKEMSAANADEFDHSEDFRWCRCPGLPPFTFSKKQAKAIKALFEALQHGKPGLSTRALSVVVDTTDADFSIERLFRGPGKTARDGGFLVKIGPDFWTLNLAPKRP